MFTSDFGIPSEKLAALRSISLYELEAGSQSEQDRLLQACIQDGFFCLDLTHPSFSTLLDDVESVFKVSREMFDYPTEIKELFDVDRVSQGLKVNGYKPKGRNVVSKTGSRDGFESWVLPRNGLMQLSNEPFSHPPAVADNLGPLTGLVGGLNSAACTILAALSRSLSIPIGQHFEDFQRPNCPSPDILRLLKYHANPQTTDVPQTPHTDLGSLTFVFSDMPGLQVLPVGKGSAYDEKDWRYVLPKPGHAVVNIGDCISMMTNGLLKSALHRVGPVEGRAMPQRYSMAYLMRPEDATVLKAVESPQIPRSVTTVQENAVTSGEWVRKKFTALRGNKDVMGAKGGFDSILTGGRGILA
jgi:isopenicillin N synthase-like dioxygenase